MGSVVQFPNEARSLLLPQNGFARSEYTVTDFACPIQLWIRVGKTNMRERFVCTPAVRVTEFGVDAVDAVDRIAYAAIDVGVCLDGVQEVSAFRVVEEADGCWGIGADTWV